MGNSLACFSEKNQTPKIKKTKKITKISSSSHRRSSSNGHLPIIVPPPPCISRSSSSHRNSDKLIYSNFSRINHDHHHQFDGGDQYIREQARVAATLLLQHHQQNGTLSQFERSISLRDSLITCSSRKQKRNINMPRSSSTRARSLSDSLPQNFNLLHQGTNNVEDMKNKHFILVHGGGFGAWCWYKTTTLLKEFGYQVDAIDLTGSGSHLFDSNNITTLSQYVKPLIDFLEKINDDKKVILVGHDIGGACISYAMELYPSKVSASIFVAAAMLKDGQSTLDMFSVQDEIEFDNSQLGLNNLCQRAQIFRYANGKNNPPTSIDYDKSLLKEVLFNQTPTKDVELASMSMRQVPFGPLKEKLSLSSTNYGSIPRFYIKTQDDFAIPSSLQEVMIDSNQPQQVFQIKGSDHSPFLSKPQALHKILVEISNMNLKNHISKDGF